MERNRGATDSGFYEYGDSLKKNEDCDLLTTEMENSFYPNNKD